MGKYSDHCYKCKTDKNLHVTSTDKRYGYKYHVCRECSTATKKEYRATEAGAEKTYQAIKKSDDKYKDKRSARAKVKYALKTNKLVKPTNCKSCNLVRALDGHHPDYSKPLEVVWLCRQCHADTHSGIIKELQLNKEDIGQLTEATKPKL